MAHLRKLRYVCDVRRRCELRQSRASARLPAGVLLPAPRGGTPKRQARREGESCVPSAQMFFGGLPVGGRREGGGTQKHLRPGAAFTRACLLGEPRTFSETCGRAGDKRAAREQPGTDEGGDQEGQETISCPAGSGSGETDERRPGLIGGREEAGPDPGVRREGEPIEQGRMGEAPDLCRANSPAQV
jgi:hypothetical protein